MNKKMTMKEVLKEITKRKKQVKKTGWLEDGTGGFYLPKVDRKYL